MTKTHGGAGLRRLKGIIAARAATGLSDAELLERFVGRREEAAFAALVERHGPMVLRVGWATLHQLQDAEDVFQATFLVLARRASTVRKQASLGSWLHGVAYRLALKLSARAAARRRREAARSAPATTNADALTCREMESMLHEELHRLPERLRAPLVLCYLEGKTRDEAAARLGVPVGTLKGRLEKGRERLRNALVRRGVTPALAAAALTLSHDLLTAAVPERLTLATVQAAGLFVENQTLAGSMTTAAAALANEMSHSLTCSKAPTLAGLLLAGGLIACCALYYPAASEPAQQKARPTEASTPVVTTKADAQGDPLPDGAIARLGSLRWRHGGEARSLAFSADGKTLAVASREDGIYFFETTTGRVVRRLPINAQLVAYAPTKPLLAAMDDTGVVSLHDANNEKPMLLKGKATQQRCLVFSADSKYLAAVDRDARVVIWDVERGMPTAELVGHNHGNPQFLFSPDGLVLALGAVNPKVQFWDARTGKLLRGFEPDVELVLSLAYAPDGRSIAVGGRNNIVIAEAATGKELQRFEADKMNGVLGVAFTPDGKTIVSGSEDAKLRVWDVASGKERFVLDSRGWLGRSLAVSRDGKLAAMGTVYSVIRLFDVTTGRQVSPEPEAHDAAVHAVAVSSDGKLVASGGENQQLRLWDASGQPLRRIHASAKSVSFAPDGRRLASTWLWNKQVRVWDAQDGKEVYKLRRDGDHETATVGFSSDGKTIASTGLIQRADKDSPWLTELRVWDALSGKKIRTVDIKNLWPYCAALSPDGRRAVVGGQSDAPLRVCDLQRGAEVHRPFPDASYIVSAAFSPDGRLIAAGSINLHAYLCETVTGKEVLKLTGHQQSVAALAFRPDGRVLATADGGPVSAFWKAEGPQHRIVPTVKTIRFWDVATGGQLLKLESIQSDVTSLAFTPDGQRLISGHHDGTVLIWDLGEKLRLAPRKGREIDAKEFDSLWTTLASNDAARAYRAVEILACSCDHAAPWLKKRLEPAQPLDAAKVKQWIADLDSDKFAVRDAATRSLAALGEDVEPQVLEALAKAPPIESSRRLERLLASLQQAPPPERLRTLRIIWALERSGAVAGREMLATLAGGAPESNVTRQAAAAIARLSGADRDD